MKLLDNLALRRKITGSFIIVFLSFLVIGAIIYQGIREIQQLNYLITVESQVLSFIHQTRQNNLGLRYRAYRLYNSSKIKDVDNHSESYADDVREINEDLAEADSLYALIRDQESEELNRIVENNVDSTLHLANNLMLPNLLKSLDPLRDYVTRYVELNDYLEQDSVEDAKVQQFWEDLDDLEDNYDKYEDVVVDNYSVVNALVKQVRDGLEGSISMHQVNIRDIIDRTLITVVATIGIALVLIVLVNTFLNRIIIPAIQKVVMFLTEFAEGKFPDIVLKETGDEIGHMAAEINKLKTNLEASTSFANAIGAGDFDVEFEAKDALGQSLVGMRDSLKKTYEDEKSRKFISDGLSKLNRVLTEQSDSIQAFGDNLLRSVIKYLDFQVGAFYVVYEEDGEVSIRMEACFAFDRKKYISKSIEPGQGIVGQVFLEGDPVYLEEIPHEYMDVRSGLGDAPPSSIFVVPLLHNEKIHGLMEFASLTKMTDGHLHFLKETANAIASVLSSRIINKNTELLLEETQQKTEELRSQEEEMRQNMEELQATQEAMSRNENRSKAILEKIREAVITFDSEGTIDTANEALCKILGYTAEELEGDNIKALTRDFQTVQAYIKKAEAVNIDGKELTFITKTGQSIPLEASIDEFMFESERIFICVLKKTSSAVAI